MVGCGLLLVSLRRPGSHINFRLAKFTSMEDQVIGLDRWIFGTCFREAPENFPSLGQKMDYGGSLNCT